MGSFLGDFFDDFGFGDLLNAVSKPFEGFLNEAFGNSHYQRKNQRAMMDYQQQYTEQNMATQQHYALEQMNEANRLQRENNLQSAPIAVRSARAAGINPSAMQGDASTVVSSAPSGSAPSGPSPSGSSFPMSDLSSLAMLGTSMAQRQLIKEQAEEQRIKNERMRSENLFYQNLEREAKYLDPETHKEIPLDEVDAWSVKHHGQLPDVQVLPPFRDKGSFDAFRSYQESVNQGYQNDKEKIDLQLKKMQFLNPDVRDALVGMPVAERNHLFAVIRELSAKANLEISQNGLVIKQTDIANIEEEIKKYDRDEAKNLRIGPLIEKITAPDVSFADVLKNIVGVVLMTGIKWATK